MINVQLMSMETESGAIMLPYVCLLCVVLTVLWDCLFDFFSSFLNKELIGLFSY